MTIFLSYFWSFQLCTIGTLLKIKFFSKFWAFFVKYILYLTYTRVDIYASIYGNNLISNFVKITYAIYFKMKMTKISTISFLSENGLPVWLGAFLSWSPSASSPSSPSSRWPTSPSPSSPRFADFRMSQGRSRSSSISWYSRSRLMWSLWSSPKVITLTEW